MKRVLKTLFLIILLIIAIPIVGALFISKDFAVSKEVVINKPKQQVFDYIKLLRNQDYFSEWNKMDPAMQKEYKGIDGMPGFVYAWDSESAGKGEMEIQNIVEGERVEIALHFIKPFESDAQSAFITEEVGMNQTKVTWELKGRNDYPLNFMNLFSNSTIGTPIHNSLIELKSLLEKE
jgi:uncharacterized protein YndB with AHSA1/START domain